jgi:hypothetical protein
LSVVSCQWSVAKGDRLEALVSRDCGQVWTEGVCGASLVLGLKNREI